MLAIMERYLASPLDGDPDDLDRIRVLGERSPDILIEIDAPSLPFLAEDLDLGVKQLLLTGFIAGNAASQLRAGSRHPDVFAGVTGELKIYRALKALAATKLKDRKVISAGLEALLDLEARGQLRAHLDQVLARPRPASVTLAEAADAPAADLPANLTEEQLDKLNSEGQRVLTAGHPEAAITGYFDKVLASYQSQYATDKRHIYCAHSPAESLLYMTTAANHGEDAVALSPIWADAWFLKSYALTNLHRLAEARVALEHAVALSPSYSPYLGELGYLHHKAKDWRRALELYVKAEDSVELVPDPKWQIHERTRALRGQGFVLEELGNLDAAEQRFQRSLTLNPDDSTSKNELVYLKQLKAKHP
jgi:tetratricopeptide (TPR) repeat protein